MSFLFFEVFITLKYGIYNTRLETKRNNNTFKNIVDFIKKKGLTKYTKILNELTNKKLENLH